MRILDKEIKAIFASYSNKQKQINLAGQNFDELCRNLKKLKKSPFSTIRDSFENCKPLVRFKKKRMKNTSYKIPTFLKKREQILLMARWFTEKPPAAKKPQEVFANNLLQASLKSGAFFSRRNELHKIAKINKAFSHYRWF